MILCKKKRNETSFCPWYFLNPVLRHTISKNKTKKHAKVKQNVRETKGCQILIFGSRSKTFAPFAPFFTELVEIFGTTKTSLITTTFLALLMINQFYTTIFKCCTLLGYLLIIFISYFWIFSINEMMKNRQQRLTMKKVEIQCRNNTDYYVSIVQKFRWNKLHCSILVLFYIRTTINDSEKTSLFVSIMI